MRMTWAERVVNHTSYIFCGVRPLFYDVCGGNYKVGIACTLGKRIDNYNVNKGAFKKLSVLYYNGFKTNSFLVRWIVF